MYLSATSRYAIEMSGQVDLVSGFYRAMLCIRGTSHGPVTVCLSVRLSVCPSVCLSVRYKSVFY